MAIKPTKCISVTEARQLQDTWVATRAAEIERARGSEDTREFVFSHAELQQFLDYVKDASDKQGILAPGVRIYFGAYDSSISNKATVFLSATKGTDVNSENNYTIDPLNTVTGGYPPNVF